MQTTHLDVGLGGSEVLAARFGGFVFRCLRVAVPLCLCALAWSLF